MDIKHDVVNDPLPMMLILSSSPIYCETTIFLQRQSVSELSTATPLGKLKPNLNLRVCLFICQGTQQTLNLLGLSSNKPSIFIIICENHGKEEP
jgi:hypothetical protein